MTSERVKSTDPTAKGSSPGRRSHWDDGALIAVINGVLTGVAGVYLATGSTAVTSIACLAAVGLAALIVVRRGERRKRS